MNRVLAHLSDLHLGFRAFPARDRGWNLRERDAAASFQTALDGLARVKPRLLLLTGDLFHRPDPPSTAFLTLTRGLRTLQSRVPGVTILAIAGERDTPLAPGDPGPVAVLDVMPGVHAASGAPRAIRLDEGRIHALLVPFAGVRGGALPDLRPDPEAELNLLLIRGRRTPSPRTLALDPDEWDYVAVGGDHLAWNEGEHIRCPGSLERVGWDPWSEATEEKGFITWDLDRRRAEFVPVPTRVLVDLAPIRVSRDAPGEGTRRLRHLVEGIPGGVAGKLVRIRLRGDIVLPEEGVEGAFLEGLRRKAAHLEVQWGPGSVDGRRPAVASLTDLHLPAGPGSVQTLPPGIHLAVLPEGVADRGLPEGILEPLEAQAAAGASGLDQEALFRLLLHGGEPGTLLEEGARLLDSASAAEGGTATSNASASQEDEPQDGEGAAGAGEELAPPGGEPPKASTEGSRAGGDGPRSQGGAAHSDDGVEEPAARELRLRREDLVEAEGEVEARTLEWARDRQEAESRLQAYRDQALELRRRLRELDDEGAVCPTCERTLGEVRSALREKLQDEWEMVVQDGKWWKRRREQLEERPEDLRALEAEALRLRARLERIEATRPLAAFGGGGGGEGTADLPLEAKAKAEGPRGEDTRRVLLQLGSSHLRRWFEGRLLGLARLPGGQVGVMDRGGPRAPFGGELPGISLCLHLALARATVERLSSTPRVLLLRGVDGRGVDPLLPLLRALSNRVSHIVVLVPGDAPLPGDGRVTAILRLQSGVGGSGAPDRALLTPIRALCPTLGVPSENPGRAVEGATAPASSVGGGRESSGGSRAH